MHTYLISSKSNDKLLYLQSQINFKCNTAFILIVDSIFILLQIQKKCKNTFSAFNYKAQNLSLSNMNHILDAELYIWQAWVCSQLTHSVYSPNKN